MNNPIIKYRYHLKFTLIACFFNVLAFAQARPSVGAVDAESYGFTPTASGIENTRALQRAVDQTGTISISKPGIYKLAGTVYIGSNTSLICGNNVVLKKVNEQGDFTHVLLNKGALNKTYNEHITLSGLQIMVNGVDKICTEVYGLRGQVAFFYVKDVKIECLRCLDLGKAQYCIQVCTFEDLLIDDVIIKGDKDGVHLGRGKRFKISNAIFQTFDDAIALNAHDYSSSNPELGWIENGVIENCHDLNAPHTAGYFCRILAGGWIDWKPGMEVQQSDAVVANGRVYRVQAKADGTVYKSITKPEHTTGAKVLDGINWGVVQPDVQYTAGVRNVVFRDIFLEKPRLAFSVHFDNDRYSRSYYPGAAVPRQEQLMFDHIQVLYNEPKDFIAIGTPVDVITICNSNLKNNSIKFWANKAMADYFQTNINIYGCVFSYAGNMTLINNSVDQKKILLKTSSNTVLSDNFSAGIVAGKGLIQVDSDLKGLNK